MGVFLENQFSPYYKIQDYMWASGYNVKGIGQMAKIGFPAKKRTDPEWLKMSESVDEGFMDTMKQLVPGAKGKPAKGNPAKKLNAEQVKTHTNASGYSLFEPLDENFKTVTLESIENIYAVFLKRVATGRKMTVEQVNEIAQGRVWTGTDALKNGLVDELGGLDVAIEIAAKKGKLKPGAYKVVVYPKAKSFFDQLLSSAMSESSMAEKFAAKNLPWAKSILELERWKKREGYLALMPYLMEFE